MYYMYITSTLHEKLIIIRPVLHGWSNTMWTCLWNYIASWKDMIIVGQTNSNFFSLCELMWRALICIANDPKKTMHTTYKNWWSITCIYITQRSKSGSVFWKHVLQFMSETYVNANFHLKNNWSCVYQWYSKHDLCNIDIKIYNLHFNNIIKDEHDINGYDAVWHTNNHDL